MSFRAGSAFFVDNFEFVGFWARLNVSLRCLALGISVEEVGRRELRGGLGKFSSASLDWDLGRLKGKGGADPFFFSGSNLLNEIFF